MASSPEPFAGAVFTYATCRFQLRTLVKDGYNYEDVTRDAVSDYVFKTTMPPVVGDIVSLGKRGSGEVVARQWLHAHRGSMTWPFEGIVRERGVMLDLIVVETIGVYRDEGTYPPDPGDAAEGSLT